MHVVGVCDDVPFTYAVISTTFFPLEICKDEEQREERGLNNKVQWYWRCQTETD